MLKYAFNLIDDGLVGQQVFAAEATRLAYGTDRSRGGPRRLPRAARPGLVGLPLALLIAAPGVLPVRQSDSPRNYLPIG